MPDPIRSSTPPQSVNPNSDPYSDDVGKMCRPDAPNSSLAQSSANSSQAGPPAPSAPAVAKLVGAAPAGMGAGISVGVRDVDRDGSGELCARVSVGPVTVGVCLENPL